ncbi:unnamed protein product [Caenorhabditis sp. 36 PRJEB53466]|nr:unnamed protein product [Caenorhabditis sp. 36 PRJEB53466]
MCPTNSDSWFSDNSSSADAPIDGLVNGTFFTRDEYDRLKNPSNFDAPDFSWMHEEWYIREIERIRHVDPIALDESESDDVQPPKSKDPEHSALTEDKSGSDVSLESLDQSNSSSNYSAPECEHSSSVWDQNALNTLRISQ